jgi:hypothetical protein
MKLIRKDKPKPPAHRAVDVVRLAVRGLVAQRVARKAFRGYKWARRIPYLLGAAALAGALAKLLGRRRGGATAQEPYQPPAPVSSSATSTATSAAAPPAPEAPEAPEAPASPEVAAAVTDGAPGPELGDFEGPPAGEPAPEPQLSTGEPATEPELDVEAPNESTPPPAGKKAEKP